VPHSLPHSRNGVYKAKGGVGQILTNLLIAILINRAIMKLINRRRGDCYAGKCDGV